MMGSNLDTRIRHVTAVLGPTNTGKTHLAIERMLGHETGMIGLPLRLLAREVYDKIGNRIGFEKVALITGEEKIKPENARFWVSTVEAMPRDINVDFLAIDEVQLAADPERGHVFTDRLLHARGRQETFLLGAGTIRDVIQDLIPGANFISRPRLSRLSYTGQKKITRLGTRTAVVAFSANDVYSLAELIRRQRGGAAVVLGALSPRTRNAQVELYQSGDVDFLVATDAIGMGLNLDVDHVAFAAVRKFDGHVHRNLTPGELGQIAGRAGRHMNDGTFGVTGDVEPFENDLVERLETHTFDPIRVLQWRSNDLNFNSIDALRDSLRALPNEPRLTRARSADDVDALETLARDNEIVDMAKDRAAVARLWEMCQLPDYRKISSASHAELIGTLYKFLMSGDRRIPEDWFAKQVAFADRTDGDIDTLANRIAHIRTWTFVSKRADWLQDPGHWQGRTREIEDALSDAMHERLTQRFVDKRTSALMKGMRDKEELTADIKSDGSVSVEDHYVGRLIGFRFSPETHAGSLDGKAARFAAAQVLNSELSMRARRVAAAKAEAFKFTRDGTVLWNGEAIGQLEAGEDPLKPAVKLLCDEHLSQPDKDKVQARLDRWVEEVVGERLKPLVELATAEDVTGLSRGIAFQLKENFGVLKREAVANEIKTLDQPSRAQLRKYGVRFGAFNIYLPLLLKPAPAELLAMLWTLKNVRDNGLQLETLPEAPRAGLTSVAADPAMPEALYQAYGFHLCGPRAVRLDILERLADLIRPLVAWRKKDNEEKAPPNGATGDGGFTVTPDMMSILGCSPGELGNVLKALGFRLDRRPAPQLAAVTETASDAGDEAAAETDAAEGTEGGEAAASQTAPVADAPEVPEAASVEAASASADEPGAAEVDTASPEAVSAEPPAIASDAEVAPAATAGEVGEPGEVGATQAAGDGEAATVAAAGEQGPASEAEAEVVYIEIWRPRRHRADGERSPRRGKGQGRGRRSSGNGAAAHAGGPESSGAATGDRAAVQGRSEGDEKSGGGGRNRPKGGRPGGKRFDGDRPGGDRGPRKNRNDRDRNRGGNRKPEFHTSSPKRSAKMDPDSPFAALSALKDAMEQQTDKEG